MKTYDPHKTATEVRQGNRRLMNLRVLAVSLVIVVLAFSILYVVFWLHTPPTAQ